MKLITFSTVLVLWATISLAQNTLVKDFNGTSASSFSYSSYDGIIAKVGSKVLVRRDAYNSTTSSTETKLYSVTISGTTELLVTVPYRDESYSQTFSDFKTLTSGNVVFVVNDDDTNYKIVTTDGTLAGTQELTSTTGEIYGLELISNGLYFTRKKLSGNDYELMKIDLGTSAVTNVIDVGYYYAISDICKTNADSLVFYASDPNDAQKLKLYVSDGTNAGTVPIKLLYSGSGVSQQTVMTQVGDKVFFFYKESGTDCCNFLWVTDGTASGTSKIKEFNIIPFQTYERYSRVISWNSKFYFMAVENGASENNNRILWVSDGTVAGTTALNSATDFKNPRSLVIFDSKLYFTAYNQNSYNYKLYSTDGTLAGTQLVSVKYNGTNINAYEAVTDGSYLYMGGYAGSLSELFRYDGSTVECGISRGADTDDDTEPYELFVNGSNLFFIGYSAINGQELFTPGTFTTASTNAIMKASTKDFSVYPNPAQSMLYVKANGQVARLALLNSQGKEVIETSSDMISLETVKGGVYELRIELENGTVNFERVVVFH